MLHKGLLCLCTAFALDIRCPREFKSPRGHCLLEEHAGMKLFSTNLNITHTETVPTSQRSGHCLNCWYDNGLFVASQNRLLHGSIDVSHSQWSEFFHWFSNDRVSLHNGNEFQGQYVIRTPVFYIPIITLHVGHILIDIIEQLYSTMIEHYGSIPADVLIILDVAQASERDVLQNKIDTLINDQSSFGTMLRWFTDIPILSALTLQQSQLRILFSDLHIGLDIEHTYFNQGYRYHPHPFRITDRSTKLLAARYQRFRDYVQAKAALSYDPSYAASVLLIQRSTNRVITNFNKLLMHLDKMNISFNALDFDGVSFTDQLKYLYGADVLVATAGTALHNMLFMRPGSSVIILMQPEWCDWAWQYANQAVLLDIHATVICGKEVQQKYFSWTKNFWRQGPRMTKLENMSADLVNMINEVQRASLKENISPDVSYVRDIHPEYAASNALGRYALEIVLSNVVAERKITDMSTAWELRLMGEITSRSAAAASIIYASLPYIAVCMNFPLTPFPSPVCYPFTTMMNYYSDIIVNSDSSTLWLHLWLQMSPGGGKIVNSDYLDIIDTRVSFATVRNVDSIANLVMLPVQCTTSENSRHELARALNCKCKYDNLANLQCYELISQVYNEIFYKNVLTRLNLPPPQPLPSPIYPFVFLHFEKSAGTTLREFIAEGAEKNRLDYFIPCHGGTHCITFSLNDTIHPVDSFDRYSNISVVAGHFEWGIWNDLPSAITPQCMLIGRHPVDRAISYYYQRCFREETCKYFQRKINDFSVEELLEMAVVFRHGLQYNASTVVVADDGIANAVCRAMVNKRTTIGVVATSGVQMPLPDDLTEEDVELALQRAENCVIGILERWDDTKRVLQHWFPWYHIYDDRRKMSLFKTKESIDVVRTDIRLALEEVNYCDMKLYDRMLAIFDKELEMLRIHDASYYKMVA